MGNERTLEEDEYACTYTHTHTPSANLAQRIRQVELSLEASYREPSLHHITCFGSISEKKKKKISS